MSACVSCAIRLDPVFPGAEEYGQYDNALQIELLGGYGMFFDNIEDGNHRVFLCHDCAHQACEALPWLGELIQPEKSHVHREDM